MQRAASSEQRLTFQDIRSDLLSLLSVIPIFEIRVIPSYTTVFVSAAADQHDTLRMRCEDTRKETVDEESVAEVIGGELGFETVIGEAVGRVHLWVSADPFKGRSERHGERTHHPCIGYKDINVDSPAEHLFRRSSDGFK